MATYAIGDLHGCYEQLQELLKVIEFNKKTDTLWFTGDLINGGPKPAETIRFIKSLGDRAICVLGNHDLVLLGIASGEIADPVDRPYGFEPVLQADDSKELIQWISKNPLVHYDQNFDILLAHAGVLPLWSVKEILSYAKEVENIIQSEHSRSCYKNMYGNEPTTWSESLEGWDRVRFIINCFTRMRFCNSEGTLELETKGDIGSAPFGYKPWFKVAREKLNGTTILFGHWAALMGETNDDKVVALDTGCMWGHSLTALRLDDMTKFSIKNPL